MIRFLHWIAPVWCAVVGLINFWQGETLEGLGWFILSWLMYIAKLLEKRT